MGRLDGVLLHIGVEKGKTAPVDSVLAVLGKEGEDITALLASGAGNSTNSAWPSLAGQNASYIETQLRHFHERGKPTALLCHGPIAIVSAMPHAREFRSALIAGDPAKASAWAEGWQYAGYKMTVFSATEEKVIEDNLLHAKLYFNMPDALRTAGGEVSVTVVDFDPYVVEDRELITGQNPRSDHPIAAKLVAALDRFTAAG